MGKQLPADIMTLAIPAHQDARGSDASLIDVFDGADEVRAKAKEQADFERRLDYDISTMDTREAESYGRVSTGVSASAQAEQLRKDADKRQRDNVDTQVQLAAMREAAEAARDAARARIQIAEDGFEAEFGDAWREEIALRVYGDEDIPQRREGESIEDYRERLEEELVDKMIDPETGKIRPEYADDPNMRRYAEWAQDKWIEDRAERVIERASDPNASPEEVEADLAPLETWSDLRQGDQHTAKAQEPVNEHVNTLLEANTDGLREDSVSNTSNATDGGFSLGI